MTGGKLTLLQHGDAHGVLELVETPLEHVLGTDTLDSHQVENHVVSQVECRVKTVRLTLDHTLGSFRLELGVAHHDDDTAGIKSTTTSASAHLHVFLGGHGSYQLA